MIIPHLDAPELSYQGCAQQHRVSSFATEDYGRLLADLCQLYHGLSPVQGAVCAVKDVGPIGIGPYYQGAGEKQAGADIADGLLGGGGCEGQDLVRTQAENDIREQAVCRTEILAPLGDDMGFVHYQQADAALAELVHHIAVLKTLGCGDHDFRAVVQSEKELAPLIMRLAASDADTVDSCLPEP